MNRWWWAALSPVAAWVDGSIRRATPAWKIGSSLEDFTVRRFLSLLALLTALFCAAPARAQFIGYTSPQTVSTVPFNTTSCVGITKSATVSNIGQSVHVITYSVTGSTVPVTVRIMGGNDGTNFVSISDDGTSNG